MSILEDLNKNKKNNNLELLAPVGSYDSMISALNAGCNAIYLGGKDFNARQSASNFDNEQLKEIIAFCHLRGVKVNLTLNILYKQHEVQNVLKFVAEIYSYGVDAFIVQDIGIFSLIKSNFPKVKLHASTQMTIHNLEGVLFLENLGFDRVVLSRELSLEEIEYITGNTKTEIEAFIHGAICVSYSGRCLMSSMIGERSGNRGRCAQPCRMQYTLMKDKKVYANNYLLSPKDTSTLPIIDKLINSGIHTFKIEGRMKSPEYISAVTSTYRKYIDMYLNTNKMTQDKQDIKELTQIFNRGGSSITGYYEAWSGKSMISASPKSSGIHIGVVESYNFRTKKCNIKIQEDLVNGDGIEVWTKTIPHTGTNISKPAKKGDTISVILDANINKGDLVYRSFDKALDKKLKNSYHKSTRQQKIVGYFSCKIGEPFYLKLSLNQDLYIELYGDVVEGALKNALTKEALIKNLSKTGNTPFFMEFEDSSLLEENAYLPVSVVNNLRRDAISLLEDKILDSYVCDRDVVNTSSILNTTSSTSDSLVEQKLTVSIQTTEQFSECLKFDSVKRIYIPFSRYSIEHLDYFITNAKLKNKEVYISLPSILRKPLYHEFYSMIEKFENFEIDGYLIKNYININTQKNLIADYTFNIFNNYSIDVLLNNNIKKFNAVTLSPELNLKELKALNINNTEVLVYGKIPLMTTHQCPVGLYVGEKNNTPFCKLKYNSDSYYLRDRKNIDFPIVNDCLNCTSTILSDSPICVITI